ncbi:MAG: TauD/TfdA dioxygenase family protein [Hyphomicrobiaceae bacterium]
MVEFKPLSRHTGAEILGVDLTRPLQQGDVARIWRIFTDHCVAVFRGQQLDQKQLVEATAQFGKCAAYTRPKEFQSATQRQTLPEIMLISNIREDGKPIGAHPDGEMWFHHDTIHREVPTKATLLYAVEVPTWGGETVFSNLFAAYDALPEDLRSGLDGRRAVNAFTYGSNRKGDPNAVKASSHAVHPAIRTHEENGRKAIYVDRLMTQCLEDVAEPESVSVLERTFDHIESEAFLYVHSWRAGDVVMWDNRSSIHARRDFPADQRRLMWRTTVAGDTRPY